VKRYNSLWDAPDKNRFFENPPMVSFQKTDFGVSSAFGTGNTKIGFKMRIAGQDVYIITLGTGIA
jgi:hypothetical protein